MTDQKSQPSPSDNRPNETAQTEADRLRQQAEEYLNGWKRAKADYANLQKETERRQSEFIQFANAALIHELLPLIDHFKQAFMHLPAELNDSEWVKGIRHIQTHLNKILAEHGIQEIRTVGEKFDPTRHEAIEEVDSDQPAGTIIEELKTGFLLHERVLQAARVKIAKSHKEKHNN
ncbi:MAG: nucleotide exchange factor GrpE [Patescibacteria group bacterium]